MTKRQKLNWALMVLGLSLLSLLASAINFRATWVLYGQRSEVETGKIAEEFDPIAAGDRVEAATRNIDVMHIGLSRGSQIGMGVFHIGVRFYPMENPWAVELTDTGWKILSPGEYVWEPGQEEDIQDKWTFWTVEKYEHFSENAMWSPGKSERVKPAIRDLKQWHEDWLTVELLNAVFPEAMNVYGEWIAIEVSYIGLGTPTEAAGQDDSGQPGYYTVYSTHLGAIEMIFVKLPHASRSGHLAYSRRRDYWIPEVMGRGGLTVEEYRELKEFGTISVMPGFHPVWGSVPYIHGFNHPWRGQ